MLQNELNRVASYKDPRPRNMADCNPLHRSKAAAAATTVKAKEKGELDMLIPQRHNEVTLHNRYSVLSDSTLSETKEDDNSHESNDTEDNEHESNINSTKLQQKQKRRIDKDHSITSKRKDFSILDHCAEGERQSTSLE